jgi:hypothetical protein
MKLDPRELQAIDAPLIALTQQCNGDLRKLLFCFFSFLQRRTDFYLVSSSEDAAKGVATMGFAEGEAEKLLLAAFRQFPLRRVPPKGAGKSNSDTKPTLASDSASTEKAKASMDKAKSAVGIEEKASSEPVETTKANVESDDSPDTVRLTEEGLQVPVGNGGSTNRYKWTQTIDECSVLVGIPDGLRGKDLSVSIKASSVAVLTKKPMEGEKEVHTFLKGDLTEKIRPEESTWTLEGGVMVMQLYKQHKAFWKTIVQGDAEIDTTMVDSRRHIREYDESTQVQIRKIMFDENQARQGLPGSQSAAVEPGGKLTVPPLPDGVEYIDQDILNEKTKMAPKK